LSVFVCRVISDYGLVLARDRRWRERIGVELVIWNITQHDVTVEYLHMSSFRFEILNIRNYAELLSLSASSSHSIIQLTLLTSSSVPLTTSCT
jgi:hypothetical protein